MLQSDLIKLVKEVFSEGPGAELLKVLENETCSPNMFDENTNRVYWRVGQLDLIRRLRSMVDISAKDVDVMEKAEKQLEDEYGSKPLYNEFGDII